MVHTVCAYLQDFVKQHNFSSLSTIEDFRGDLVRRQKEAIEQSKAERRGLKSDKDWSPEMGS
ncbi:hypothetical protein Bca52824_018966 [Brassica carinata]|uniref:Uncharacterized protein n=1 Tax=Brassica carinata TaxID=52824 RepID=A0A8X7VQX7_BRACI|nr:hypothetical protein Bca52824_018966 [Brassica carinata]